MWHLYLALTVLDLFQKLSQGHFLSRKKLHSELQNKKSKEKERKAEERKWKRDGGTIEGKEG